MRRRQQSQRCVVEYLIAISVLTFHFRSIAAVYCILVFCRWFLNATRNTVSKILNGNRKTWIAHFDSINEKIRAILRFFAFIWHSYPLKVNRQSARRQLITSLSDVQPRSIQFQQHRRWFSVSSIFIRYEWSYRCPPYVQRNNFAQLAKDRWEYTTFVSGRRESAGEIK